MRTIVARPVHPEKSGAPRRYTMRASSCGNPLLRGGRRHDTKGMPRANEEADRAGDQKGKDRSSTLVTCPRRLDILQGKANYEGAMRPDQLRRRGFIAVLGGAAGWLLLAYAQPLRKLPAIGFLGADASGWGPWTTAFLQRMAELGWIDGRTITINYRWSEGSRDRDVEAAAEFVRQKVDIIVSHGAAIPSLKQATSDIPIVFAIALDPIGAGLVTNLARPGGNVTGLSRQSTDLGAKRLQLLREAVPNLRRLAIMAMPLFGAELEMEEVQAAARTLGIEVTPVRIRQADEFVPAFARLKGQVDALYVVTNAPIGANRARIITLALDARLPTMFSTRDLVQAGGLMSYGPNFEDMFRRTAEIVDRILRGTKPGEIAVEQPTKFELIINLGTARALGLKMPRMLTVYATELIE
jgi:putative tryptophan/tyrosine transport system substrate-binding protein